MELWTDSSSCYSNRDCSSLLIMHANNRQLRVDPKETFLSLIKAMLPVFLWKMFFYRHPAYRVSYESAGNYLTGATELLRNRLSLIPVQYFRDSGCGSTKSASRFCSGTYGSCTVLHNNLAIIRFSNFTLHPGGIRAIADPWKGWYMYRGLQNQRQYDNTIRSYVHAHDIMFRHWCKIVDIVLWGNPLRS